MGKNVESRSIDNLRGELKTHQVSQILDAFVFVAGLMAINYLPEAVGIGHPHVAVSKVIGLPIIIVASAAMLLIRQDSERRVLREIQDIEKASQRTASLQRSNS